MKIQHDIHVHTVLSSCTHDPEQTVANILTKAEEIGIKCIGFADHLWASHIPGASPWYKPQDENHVLSIKEELAKVDSPVKVLVGCESEFTGETCGIDSKTAELFDFVILPCSHFHMIDFVRSSDITSPEQQAKLLIERLNDVLKYEFLDGLAHPYTIVGGSAIMDEVAAYMRKADDFKRFLDKAAEKQVSIEIHVGYFPQLMKKEDPEFNQESIMYLLEMSKKAGCLFHFASDSHSIENFGNTIKLQSIADELCLKEEDIHPLFQWW